MSVPQIALSATTTSSGNAPPSLAPPLPPQQQQQQQQKKDDQKIKSTAPHITCFACSRCEYPICDSSDLLLRKVRQGASEYAFQYNLDGLLDLEDTTVPCYSAAEVVHTSVVVSEDLMKVPLPPAAQVVVLESIVQSRKFWMQQRHSMNARLHEHGVSGTTPPTTAAEGTASSGGARPASEVVPPIVASTAAGPPIVRRYGDATESRIDLVCVSDAVLGTGVQECTQDRGAAATTLDSGSADTTTTSPVSRGGEAEHRSSAPPTATQTTTTTTDPTVVRDASFAHVPADVLAAATAEAEGTEWTSPGNMTVREAFMHVSRSTLSSRAPWFQDYRCVRRVQCPDCHQALGFVFCMAEPSTKKAAAAAVASTSSSGGVKPAGAATAAGSGGEGLSPSQGMKRPATAPDRDVEEAELGREEVAVAGDVHGRRGGSRSVSDRESRLRVSSPVERGSDDHRFDASAEARAEVDGARLPHAKKTKNENDAQAAAAATTRRGFQEAQQQQQQEQQQQVLVRQQLLPPQQQHQHQQQQQAQGVDSVGERVSPREVADHSSSDEDADKDAHSAAVDADVDADELQTEAPPRFVGLELKRVVQRNWDLHAFQERYSKACALSTFRELFPEAEELQSLYSRLLGLRTQTELYNSLLRRHKEQNDVQMALLNSNKDRMHTYDEKVKTMQQIIEAQRAQIEMQTRQIRNQEELVQSHRRQFATQQRQMDVEQLLLTQQSKTIESQKEQLRLLKIHFQMAHPEVLDSLHLSGGESGSGGDTRSGDNGERASPPTAPMPQRAQPEKNVTPPMQELRRDNDSNDGDRSTEEEDWADVEEDDHESEMRTAGDEAAAESDAGTRASGGHRGTPPAHLCGVPSSASGPVATKPRAVGLPPSRSPPPE